MRPASTGFQLLCITLANFCSAQYQYNHPADQQPNKVNSNENTFTQPNQSPQSSNGYQYKQPNISFTISNPKSQFSGFPNPFNPNISSTSQEPYSFNESTKFDDGSAFQGSGTNTFTSGPSVTSTASFNGYLSGPQSDTSGTAAGLSTTPGPQISSGFRPSASGTGSTDPFGGTGGGKGPSNFNAGNFGSLGRINSFGDNYEFHQGSSSVNEGSAGGLGLSVSGLEGSSGSRTLSSFNIASANGLGPSNAFSGNSGGLVPSSPFGGNAGSTRSSSDFGSIGESQGQSSLKTGSIGPVSPSASFESSVKDGSFDSGNLSAIPGIPGVDYPILAEIPKTSFSCDAQKFPGYYADVETRCQVFHICSNSLKYDFLCPNGTIFSQMYFVCVWWNQFDCSLSDRLYYLNENLYDYTKGGSSGQSVHVSNFADFSKIKGPSTNFDGLTGSQEVADNFKPSKGLQEQSANSGQFSGPQGPSVNFGTSLGHQGLSPNFGLSTGSQGHSAESGPSYGPQSASSNLGQSSRTQRPSVNFGSSSGPQGISVNYRPSSGLEGQAANFGPQTSSQEPSVIYGQPTGQQSPSSKLGPQLGTQRSSSNFGPSVGPSDPSLNFGSQTRPHGPSTINGLAAGPKSPSSIFRSSSRLLGPDSNFKSALGPQRPATSYNPPGLQITTATLISHSVSSEQQPPSLTYGSLGGLGSFSGVRLQNRGSHRPTNSYIPPSTSQNNHQSESQNFGGGPLPTMGAYAGKDYSSFLQTTSAEPQLFSTDQNVLSGDSSYGGIDHTENPFSLNQSAKPNREYLPSHRKRR